MRTDWIGAAVAGVVCLLIAILVPPYTPDPISTIIMVIGYVFAAILFVVALLKLLRGGV